MRGFLFCGFREDKTGFFSGKNQLDGVFISIGMSRFRNGEGEKQIFKRPDAENAKENHRGKDGKSADLPFSSFLEEKEKGGEDSGAEKDADLFIKHGEGLPVGCAVFPGRDPKRLIFWR